MGWRKVEKRAFEKAKIVLRYFQCLFKPEAWQILAGG